jgi:hypothetical protein
MDDEESESLDIIMQRNNRRGPKKPRNRGPAGKKTSVFDYNKHFSKDKIMKVFRGKPDDEYASLQSLSMMPISFEHTIDFRTYNSKAVYQWACSKGGKKISDL